MSEIQPGEFFFEPRPHPWEGPGDDGPHVFRTLDFRTVEWEPGRAVLEWDAPAAYAVHHPNGSLVHGGMVAMVLETALAAAAATVINLDEVFLTSNLQVEYIRATRQGVVLADAKVLRRGRQVAFCAGELRDRAGTQLAAASATQIIQRRKVTDATA